jgi:tetratricopeptide (TPR) repeat protein
MLMTHPKAIGFSVLVLVVAGSLWQWNQRRQRAMIARLPVLEVGRLEPGMKDVIAAARSVVESSPFSGKAWGTYGMVLLAQDFVTESVVCFRQAEQLDPTEFRWPYLTGVCLERLDPEAATVGFRRACELRGDLALPRVALSEMLLGRGELKEAEAHLLRAQRLSPNDPRVLLGLGRVALHHGQLDDALRWAENAARLDPQRRPIRTLLCQIHQRRGDEQGLNEQLRLLDSMPEATSDNDWPDPILAEVVKFKRGKAWTLQVATKQIFAGQIPNAIGLLEKAGGRDSDDARIVVLLGKAYLRSDRIDQAQELLEHALTKDSNYAPAHFELGNLAMVTGRWEEAVQRYAEAVRLQPDLAAAHYNLGLCHQRCGDRAQALEAFKHACRYMPSNFPAHREMAEMLLEMGCDAEAREHLEVAVKLDPKDVKLQSLIERARMVSEVLP